LFVIRAVKTVFDRKVFMPVLDQNGAMTIVAHADDDLLFMNPDIFNGIAAGEGSTTIFVTAGDAGYDDWYWQAREQGAKAAYALMAGVDDWQDEVVSVTYSGTTYEVVSSFLASAPDVRLYFLRIPDGAGAIADPADYETLARLEAGTLAAATTVDDAASYTRADLVAVLTALMEAHDPSQFRLQVAEGDFATGEHTDHVHATEFALEALAQFSGTDFQVTHYVNYQSDQLAPNLSPEDAALSLQIMQAYAAFDVGVTDENGNLLPVYLDWAARQYIAETYSFDDLPDGDVTPEPDPTPPPTTDGDVVYSLGDGPDNFLFDVNPQTGQITPKEWFSPSLGDAWDIDEDFVYDVTLIATPTNGDAPVTQLVQFDTVAEGVLDQTGGEVLPPDDETPPPDDETPPPDDETPPPDDETPPTVDDDVVYSLGDEPDSFLFDVDPQTGQITPKAWFTPSLDDAWDFNDDFVYDVTLIATPASGGTPVSQAVQFDTVAEGVLAQSGGEVEPPVDDETPPPGDETPPPAKDTPPDVANVIYTLGGADEFLFEINGQTGGIEAKDWFIPSYDDAWDQNDDHIYELIRTGTDDSDDIASRELLNYEVTDDDVLILISVTDDLLT
jgi:LmbE family N-acetylglucosaminyl deacetylase